MPMSTVLSLQGVSKSYRRGERRLRVLSEVSLDVEAGKVVAAVGQRFEGKTTLLQVSCGIEPADSGTVLFAGRDLAQLRPEERERLLGAQIAWCDGSAPMSDLTALDYVALPLRLGRSRGSREASTRAIQALERVGAPGLGRARWSELSNFERVLVSVARLIAGGPKLLVIDDLLGGLAARRIHEVSQLLRSLAGELECAVLMSASELDSVMVADESYWFERGQLVPLAPPPSGEAQVIGFPRAHQRGGITPAADASQ
jgi:putative ABC transport system ATP-binding protein